MATDSEPGNGAVSRIDPSADTIASFLADWIHVKHFYFEAASLAQELCETLLASNAIRAIVKSRVKRGPRIEAKLKERVQKLGREYRTSKDVRDDVVDLAGVRIALYFPNDREKVNKIIQDAFADVQQKDYPEREIEKTLDAVSVTTDPSLGFEQRFRGYSASHYLVRMKTDNLATKKLREDFQNTNPVIEIQVATVLMHAWTEIDHDLVHKTLTNGPASQQELRLLDAINGLIHTGEVLLQQLQSAMDDRMASQDKHFSEQYELLSYLRTRIRSAKGTMDHLDVLLLVLKITGFDSPRRLDDILEGLHTPPTSTSPPPLLILEHILVSLGEEEPLDNRLVLQPRTVHVDKLILDKTNKKFYLADISVRDRFLDQKDILETAVSVADAIRFPEKSILVVEGMPQNHKKFYELHDMVHSAIIRPDKRGRKGERWLCDIALKELDTLWTWFETNEDVVFRVSLLLARLNVEEIDQELVKLRCSSGLQRVPSEDDQVLEEASFVGSSDIGPEHQSPGYFNPSLVGQGDLERSVSTERRSDPIEALNGKEKLRDSSTSTSQSRPEPQRNMAPSPPPAVEESSSSSTEDESDEDESDEDESDEDASIIVMPERKRQPTPKPISPPPPERQPQPNAARSRSRPKPQRSMSERSMYVNASGSVPPALRSSQHAYVKDAESEDSDLDPKRPLGEPQPRYRSPTRPRPRKRESNRGPPIPEVPEVPGVPPTELGIDPDVHENARREYNERMMIEDNSTHVERPKGRRRGEERRRRTSGFYVGNEPVLRARFGSEGSGRAASHDSTSPNESAGGMYQYPGIHGLPPHNEQMGMHHQYPGAIGTPMSEPGNGGTFGYPAQMGTPMSEAGPPGGFGYPRQHPLSPHHGGRPPSWYGGPPGTMYPGPGHGPRPPGNVGSPWVAY